MWEKYVRVDCLLWPGDIVVKNHKRRSVGLAVKRQHLRTAPGYVAMITVQRERVSASRLDESYYREHNPLHIYEVVTHSGPASGPSQGHISVEQSRGMLFRTKPAVASGSQSST